MDITVDRNGHVIKLQDAGLTFDNTTKEENKAKWKKYWSEIVATGILDDPTWKGVYWGKQPPELNVSLKQHINQKYSFIRNYPNKVKGKDFIDQMAVDPMYNGIVDAIREGLKSLS